MINTKCLSRNRKEKYQFGHKDVDRRATPKLKHNHINENKRETETVPQYSHKGPELSRVYSAVLHYVRCKKQETDRREESLILYGLDM